MEKESKKIGANYLMNVSYQVFAILVPLIVTPYVSRVIGIEGIGQYSFSYAIMRYFWIFSLLGIASFGVKQIGLYKDDSFNRTKTFWNICSIKLILSSICIFAYFLFIFLFIEDPTLYLIESFYLFGAFVSISWFYQGIEKYGQLTLKNFVIKIISIILIFLLVKSASDLWIYVLILSASSFFSEISMWISLKKYLIKIPLKEVSIKKNNYWKPIVLLFFPTIASQIFVIIDKTLIGFITNSNHENGVYEQALKIVEMALVLVTSLSVVKIPYITREYNLGHKDNVVKTMQDSFDFVWFFGVPIAFGIASVAAIFVPVFFGSGYEDVIKLLYVFSPLIVFHGFHQTIGCQFLIPISKQNKYSLFLVVGGLFNICLNIPLIYFWGAFGAAISSVASEFVICILCIAYMKKTKYLSLSNLVKSSIKCMIAGTTMFLIVFFMARYISFNRYIKLMLCIVSGIVSYFLVLLLLRDKRLISVVNKINK